MLFVHSIHSLSSHPWCHSQPSFFLHVFSTHSPHKTPNSLEGPSMSNVSCIILKRLHSLLHTKPHDTLSTLVDPQELPPPALFILQPLHITKYLILPWPTLTLPQRAMRWHIPCLHYNSMFNSQGKAGRLVLGPQHGGKSSSQTHNFPYCGVGSPTSRSCPPLPITCGFCAGRNSVSLQTCSFPSDLISMMKESEIIVKG